MSFLNRLVDERFRGHRQRSTSIAGTAGGVLAIGLFAWRYYVHHTWSWALFAIAVTIVGVKVALTAWYLVTD